MTKVVLLIALFSVTLAGYAHGMGHGQGYGTSVGHSPHGHGHQGHQGHGFGLGHQGHHGHGQGQGRGWGRQYNGWANVNVWQDPHAYRFGLQEQGNGYNKFIWQGADFQQGHHDHGHQGHAY